MMFRDIMSVVLTGLSLKSTLNCKSTESIAKPLVPNKPLVDAQNPKCNVEPRKARALHWQVSEVAVLQGPSKIPFGLALLEKPTKHRR